MQTLNLPSASCLIRLIYLLAYFFSEDIKVHLSDLEQMGVST